MSSTMTRILTPYSAISARPHLPVLMLFLSAFSGVAISQEATDNRDLLQKIEVMSDENVKKIVSWKGEVKIKDDRTLDGEKVPLQQDLSFRSGNIWFAFDRANNRYCWRFVQMIDNKLADRSQRGELFLGDTRHKLSLVDLRDPDSLQDVTVGARTKRRHDELTGDFDPFDYFLAEGEDVADFCRRMREFKSNETIFKLKQVGDQIAFNRSNGRLKIAREFVFDLSQGGQLISLKTKDERQESYRVRTYAKMGGAWVPTSSDYASHQVDGKMSFRRKVEWITQEVNTPISASSFTLDSIGVLKGTRIADRRTGVVSEHQPPK